jgi:NADH-quinone oxidoreductase subunit L
MERKWYVDEIYRFLVIRPAVATANILARVDANWVIDPIVNGVGRFGRGWGNVSGWFDRVVVDGTVNLVGIVADEVSRGLRLAQTGRVQNYFVILLAGLLALAGLFFR